MGKRQDLKIGAGGAGKWEVILKFCLIWCMIGAPFAGGKFRGGFEVDFIGYYLDYAKFELGLSEARTRWLCSWMEDAGGGKVVLI